MAGLGEDASFDIAMAAKYAANIIVVDPTPRAIAHFNAIVARLGRPAETAIAGRGRIDPAAYDLSAIQPGQLALVQKALWSAPGETMKFFAPKNPAHVSHSLVDYQHDYAQAGEHIEVVTTTIEEIVADFGITRVPLIKIDIEGAEVAVLRDGYLLETLRPGQILVEMDILNLPSAKARREFNALDQRLRDFGYRLATWDRRANFTYVQPAGA
jgi:FkbM family methyltransferase